MAEKSPSSLRKSRSPLFWPIIGLVALIVLNVIMAPSFLRMSVVDGHLFWQPIDILNQASRGSLLLALGMTLVIATGGVDLSVGSIMAVAGAVAAVLLQRDVSLPLTLAAAIGAGLAVGVANGALVSGLGIQPIVATLILMVAGRGFAQLVSNGEVILVKNASFGFLGNGYVFGAPFAPILVGLLYVAAYFGLRRTAAGLFIEAVGDNETAGRFAGLSAGRVKWLVYVASGLCAAIAGLLATSNVAAADSYRVGENMELDAIFAAVVGGTALTGGRFLLAGAFIGALLLQTLTATMYNVGVPPQVAPVPKAIVILIVCLLQSEHARRWFKSLVSKSR